MNHLKKHLEERKKAHRFRQLRSVSARTGAAQIAIDGVEYINFSSNDYLGLSGHPLLIERAGEFTERYGTGSSSSRLIMGTLDIHTRLEERLAGLYRKERVLLYNTGFQANSTILPVVAGKEDWILADKKCHNSILTGCLASKARFFRFRHNDMDHLEAFLKRAEKQGANNVWVVTESIFSVDGDKAPVNEILSLSKKYGSFIYLDDAHGIGVIGENGLGVAGQYPEIDILIGTFGKAAGAFGAFVACSSLIADALINFSNGFIYTTALPPGTVGAIDAAFDMIPYMHRERKRLQSNAQRMHSILKDLEWDTGQEPSHILPLILGDEEKVLGLSEHLFQSRIAALAIRPPTVPEGESRIRFSLTSDHTGEHLERLEAAFD